MSPTATLVGSDALSTAFNPLTPVAPPADVLMLSQPAPMGWQRTAGMIGVGAAAAAAARFEARSCLAGISIGIAWGAANAPALARAVAFTDADEDAVEPVTNGPLSSVQPLAQPVAAGPTNVGASGPIVLVSAARAFAFLALALAADVPPRRPARSTA